MHLVHGYVAFFPFLAILQIPGGWVQSVFLAGRGSENEISIGLCCLATDKI